jgi:hypothetical protein
MITGIIVIVLAVIVSLFAGWLIDYCRGRPEDFPTEEYEERNNETS